MDVDEYDIDGPISLSSFLFLEEERASLRIPSDLEEDGHIDTSNIPITTSDGDTLVASIAENWTDNFIPSPTFVKMSPDFVNPLSSSDDNRDGIHLYPPTVTAADDINDPLSPMHDK